MCYSFVVLTVHGSQEKSVCFAVYMRHQHGHWLCCMWMGGNVTLMRRTHSRNCHGSTAVSATTLNLHATYTIHTIHGSVVPSTTAYPIPHQFQVISPEKRVRSSKRVKLQSYPSAGAQNEKRNHKHSKADVDARRKYASWLCFCSSDRGLRTSKGRLPGRRKIATMNQHYNSISISISSTGREPPQKYRYIMCGKM